MLTAPLETVIVGYGHAGRALHRRARNELLAAGSPAVARAEVTVVDPSPPSGMPPGTRWLPGIGALARAPIDTARTVFHIATPPSSHRQVAEALLELGARALVVEKPLAASYADAEAMVAAARAAGAHLLPVTVWPASRITQRIRDSLHRLGALRTLAMEQSKPRTDRAAAAGGHSTAFEIEIPHQLLLALYLAGPVERILSAELLALRTGGGELPDLGGARLRLRHASGTVTELSSDFTVAERRRALSIRGSAGWMYARFPLSSGHHAGDLTCSWDQVVVQVGDRPFTQFLGGAYAYLAGHAAQPPAGVSVHLHLEVCRLLDAATHLARASRPQRATA